MIIKNKMFIIFGTKIEKKKEYASIGELYVTFFAVSNSSLDERECSTMHEDAGLANGFPPLPRYPSASSPPTSPSR